jgi:acyl-CoA hydrolase
LVNHKLVLPEHLNHYGYLFGGYLLRWVDEYAYITANLDFPGHRFVTIGLENVVFRKAIRMGSVLRFEIDLARCGRTSVTYNVRVFSDSIESGEKTTVFDNRITFVNIDEEGKKAAIRTPGRAEVIET